MFESYSWLSSLVKLLEDSPDLSDELGWFNRPELQRKIHYRGYYKAVQRCQFYLRVVKTISYERAQRMSEILFSARESINKNVPANFHTKDIRSKRQILFVSFQTVKDPTFLCALSSGGKSIGQWDPLVLENIYSFPENVL